MKATAYMRVNGRQCSYCVLIDLYYHMGLKLNNHFQMDSKKESPEKSVL